MWWCKSPGPTCTEARRSETDEAAPPGNGSSLQSFSKASQQPVDTLMLEQEEPRHSWRLHPILVLTAFACLIILPSDVICSIKTHQKVMLWFTGTHFGNGSNTFFYSFAQILQSRSVEKWTFKYQYNLWPNILATVSKKLLAQLLGARP